MKAKVTIGICARNAERTIRKAIESAVSQNYPHSLIEIILVDDGSTDKTLNIMNEFKSKTDITIKIFSEKWRGLGKARNTVVDNATGEYIVWLDSDEIIEKDYVRKQTHLMDSTPKVAISTGKLTLPPGANKFLALDLVHSFVEGVYQDYKKPSKLPGTGGSIHRVNAIRQVGGFDENITGAGEDVDVARRIKEKGWLIIHGTGRFCESHGDTSTLFGMLRRYYYQGFHGRYLYQKNAVFYSLYRMNPFASFIGGMRYGAFGYFIMGRPIALLFPFYYTLKKTAWFYGFSRAR